MKISILSVPSVFALALAPLVALATPQDDADARAVPPAPSARDADWQNTDTGSKNADDHSGRWATLLGNRSEVVVGIAADYGQRYPGSDLSRVYTLPVISLQRGVLFADTSRGAGLQFQIGKYLYVSQSVFYDFGRLDRDSSWRPGSNHLAGMGDVPGSVTMRTLVVGQLTPWLSASAEAEVALRDNARRNRYRAGVEMGVLKASKDNVVVDVDTWWGDGRYNQAYFGVTPQQAGRTGLAPFKAGGGLYAWSIGASWEHRFDPHWATTLQVTGTQFNGRVTNSPIVARRIVPSATAAINYTF